jgi:hypothetical protein
VHLLGALFLHHVLHLAFFFVFHLDTPSARMFP